MMAKIKIIAIIKIYIAIIIKMKENYVAILYL